MDQISPHPNGHIQAVATDTTGRREYLYHEQWQEERAEEKFDRVLELSKKLPARRALTAPTTEIHRAETGSDSCLALHLLDRGYFRAGGEQYLEANDSYGIATLQFEHVRCGRTQWRSAIRPRAGCAGP